LSTDVHVPLHGLSLTPYLSHDMLQLATAYNVSLSSSSLTFDASSIGGSGMKLEDKFNNSLPRNALKSNNNQLEHVSNNNHEEEEVEHDEAPKTARPQRPTTASKHRRSHHHQSMLHPVYDLISVSNHHGTLHGGHYIAHVDTNVTKCPSSSFKGNSNAGNSSRWICFNDARVSYANSSSIVGPTAYVLFYKLREPTS
jgi:uncharacterized UBP type Zn finger protein